MKQSGYTGMVGGICEVLFFTSRKREEGCALPELPILVQKVSWIEGEGRLPLIVVEQRRGQIGDNSSSLVTRITTVNGWAVGQESHVREKWTLGMRYPSSLKSRAAAWRRLRGTTLPIRRDSWMTALVYGMLAQSSMVACLDRPITASISAWTFSEHHDRKRFILIHTHIYTCIYIHIHVYICVCILSTFILLH